MDEYNNDKLKCRLCLSSTKNVLSVFDENYKFLPQRIADCVNIKIRKTDKMPTSICNPCFVKIEDWYHFKSNCEYSQHYLKNMANDGKLHVTAAKEANLDLNNAGQNIETNANIRAIKIHVSVVKEEDMDIDDNGSNIETNAVFIKSETFESYENNLEEPSNVQIESKCITEKHFMELHRIVNKMFKDLLCSHCNEKFDNLKVLQEHVWRSIKVDKFTCFSCCIAFPTEDELLRHVNRKFCVQRAMLVAGCSFKAYEHYQCSICQELFVHKTLLKRHVLYEHFIKQYPDSCFHCKKEFKEQKDCNEHFQSFCFYKMYCSICKTTFDSKENFNVHTFSHNDDDTEFNFSEFIIKEKPAVEPQPQPQPEIYSCALCGIKFSTLDAWTIHQNTHENIPKSSADSYKLTLTQHRQILHELEGKSQEVECKICGKTLLRKNMKRHMEIHNRRYRCSKCIKTFSSYEALLKHTEIGCMFCIICERSFLSKKLFDSHKLVHVGEDISLSNSISSSDDNVEIL